MGAGCLNPVPLKNLPQRLEYLVMVNFELHKQLCSYFILEYGIRSLCSARLETGVAGRGV